MSLVLDNLTYYKEAFIRLIYPAGCGVCRTSLELDEKHLCHRCYLQLARLKYSEDRQKSGRQFDYLDSAWSLFSYEKPMSHVIAGIKYSKKRWLLSIFEEDLSLALKSMQKILSNCAGVVPIPIDRHRFIEREFNQAELLAETISRLVGLRIYDRLVKKKHSTPQQNQLNKEQRLINLFGAFHIESRESIIGKSFLVIDDVLTTGATANEIARALKKSGAAQVHLLTLARTELQ